jgi:hypothetical protein
VRGYFIRKEMKVMIASIFRVFKHSTLITERGELKISRVFPTCKVAKKARYYYFRCENGTLIFCRRSKNGLRKYAIIGD